MSSTQKFGDLVGAIDEGTSSARFVLFKLGTSDIICFHQLEIRNITPHEGWVEQSPVDILDTVRLCIEKTIEKLITLGGSATDIVAVGITNQRESTIVWDKTTGKPLYNAIIWLDVRTSATVDQLLKTLPNENKNHYQHLCGLPLSTYFSGVKLRWLIDNDATVAKEMRDGNCLFGTIDSWLLWNLTGGINGGKHVTDVTNASRTMLMNLKTCDWDAELLNFFGVPPTILPKIRSSSEVYGHFSDGPLQGLVLSAVLGDQQAALVGQQCLDKGDAKSTYGTGCFLLYNTGTESVTSTHGLLTTVAYQFGPENPPVYALEGSVAIAGAAIRMKMHGMFSENSIFYCKQQSWLRDNLNIISDMKDFSDEAESVDDCGGIYFVPAFSGLYAPYWNHDARGVIYGLSEHTKRGHILRATLEAVCFQVRDILEAMTKDCNFRLTKLRVDGGMTASKLLLQLQSDLVGIDVIRPKMAESTALGVAIAAARAVGKWDLSKQIQMDESTFTSNVDDNDRDQRYQNWKRAINRSLGWNV